MLWFLVSAIGTFYMMWKASAPTAKEIAEGKRKLRIAEAQAARDEKLRADRPERASPAMAGTEPTTREELSAPAPANPFRGAEEEYPEEEEFDELRDIPPRPKDGFPGSFDDIIPNDYDPDSYEGSEEEEDASSV